MCCVASMRGRGPHSFLGSCSAGGARADACVPPGGAGRPRGRAPPGDAKDVETPSHPPAGRVALGMPGPAGPRHGIHRRALPLGGGLPPDAALRHVTAIEADLSAEHIRFFVDHVDHQLEQFMDARFMEQTDVIHDALIRDIASRWLAYQASIPGSPPPRCLVQDEDGEMNLSDVFTRYLAVVQDEDGAMDLSDMFTRYVAVDTSLVQEVRDNAASDSPVNVIACKALEQEPVRPGNAGKRKIEEIECAERGTEGGNEARPKKLTTGVR